jgi:holo-[acyl-carrier protein] synthase
MTIMGVGIDILDMETARNLFERDGILQRTFSEVELQKAYGRSDRIERLAGWFAAKEAVIKALRIPRESGLVLLDIEIVHDDNGNPGCILNGKIKDSLKMGEIMISISHSKNSAVGYAVHFS